MKKILLITLVFIFAVGCTKDENPEESFQSNQQSELKLKKKNLTKSQASYTLNTINPLFTGATFGVKSTSGDIQIATANPYSYDIAFQFKWYRVSGGSRTEVLPALFTMTLPANQTYAEADMSGADFLLNQECTDRETINAQYEVEIYNAFSMGPDFDFNNLTIQNNNMNYSVEYGCGQWGI